MTSKKLELPADDIKVTSDANDNTDAEKKTEKPARASKAKKTVSGAETEKTGAKRKSKATAAADNSAEAKKEPKAPSHKPKAALPSDNAAQSDSPAVTAATPSKRSSKDKKQASGSNGQSDMTDLKILFVSPESMPFVASGGLGEVVGSLPQALCSGIGLCNVRVILPLYSEISIKYREQMTFIGSLEVNLSWRTQYCGYYRLEMNGVTYYFVDNEYYFKRGGSVYGHYDEAERFAFFCKAVVCSFSLIGFVPDIVHCHDWQSALVPVYLKYHTGYEHIKTVFTIHNIEYQGQFGLELMGDVFDLPPEAGSDLEYKGCINLMKSAIECSNLVSTVSPTYAQELYHPFYGRGLELIIKKNHKKIRGILNGINTDVYNPETDTSIYRNYNAQTIELKAENKKVLQHLCNLPENPDAPLFGVISRLVAHKGMDILSSVCDELLKGNVQLVLLGVGDHSYEGFFTSLANRYVGKAAALITYNQDLARKIYAGADISLMPSKSEPCGLAQMIACRYGTVPIVRATGGLKDSIKDCSLGEGNGFTFENYSSQDFINAIRRCLYVYDDKENWNRLRKYAMGVDFSWNRSALEYKQMYQELIG